MNMNEVYEKYIEMFPDEVERQIQFENFYKKFDDTEKLFDRKHYVGHVTSSGFIISKCRTKVLLVLHRSLNLRLQPGGHIEKNDNPFTSTLREIEEETSLSNLRPFPYHYDDNIPIDIDTHWIPESIKNGEEGHYHHDLRYVFICEDDNPNIKPSSEEVKEVFWMPISELTRQETHKYATEKIFDILSREYKTKLFYNMLLRTGFQKTPRVNTIVVSHLLPDSYYYLHSIAQVSNLKAVIPKPNSIHEKIHEEMKNDNFPLIYIKRDKVEENVKKIIMENEGNFVLFDIGGYYKDFLANNQELCSERILAIIEDTENGHQKYLEIGNKPSQLVYSVARSPLKDNEDFLVGQSIVFSADSILRDVGKLLQYLKCSVMGYGKIGSSICHNLLRMGIKPSLYDINPLKRVRAYNQLCSIPEKNEIIRNSDVIFSATGGGALLVHEFRKLKTGCYIFSATSPDDEFDLEHLVPEYTRVELAANIFQYKNSMNHYFYFVNDGKAVNFLHNAVIGGFIHLVRGEMLFIFRNILRKLQEKTPEKQERTFSNEICELEDEYKEELCELWLSLFEPESMSHSNFEMTR